MSSMMPVVEYLLSLTKPGGGKLVRFGTMLYTIPVFPPGMTITFTVTPSFGSYCSIEFWQRMSPSMVPGTITMESRHSDLVMDNGTLTQVAITEGHNLWLEILESDPLITVFTNISPVNQQVESLNFFLLVDSEESLATVRKVVRDMAVDDNIISKLDETNKLLIALIEASGGKVPVLFETSESQVPGPRPPIQGSG